MAYIDRCPNLLFGMDLPPGTLVRCTNNCMVVRSDVDWSNGRSQLCYPIRLSMVSRSASVPVDSYCISVLAGGYLDRNTGNLNGLSRALIAGLHHPPAATLSAKLGTIIQFNCRGLASIAIRRCLLKRLRC